MYDWFWIPFWFVTSLWLLIDVLWAAENNGSVFPLTRRVAGVAMRRLRWKHELRKRADAQHSALLAGNDAAGIFGNYPPTTLT